MHEAQWVRSEHVAEFLAIAVPATFLGFHLCEQLS
jgi:hypothetical protein